MLYTTQRESRRAPRVSRTHRHRASLRRLFGIPLPALDAFTRRLCYLFTAADREITGKLRPRLVRPGETSQDFAQQRLADYLFSVRHCLTSGDWQDILRGCILRDSHGPRYNVADLIERLESELAENQDEEISWG